MAKPEQHSDRAALKRTSLDAKIEALKAQRAALMKRILLLESRGMAQPGSAALATVRARELLTGEKAPGAAEPDLLSARQELAALDIALSLAAQQQQAEQIENFTAEFTRRRREWDQLNVERVKALVALRDLNARADEFLKTFAGVSALGPLANINLGRPFLGEAKTFIEQAVKSGIVTPGEVQP
ncbi:hypothetical protein [Mesorhizobium helmanticense]|nr:hypothetical protein [Mesorhizobium helmanticense]